MKKPFCLLYSDFLYGSSVQLFTGKQRLFVAYHQIYGLASYSVKAQRKHVISKSRVSTLGVNL